MKTFEPKEAAAPYEQQRTQTRRNIAFQLARGARHRCSTQQRADFMRTDQKEEQQIDRARVPAAQFADFSPARRWQAPDVPVEMEYHQTAKNTAENDDDAID
jgi:hypothetical protein